MWVCGGEEGGCEEVRFLRRLSSSCSLAPFLSPLLLARHLFIPLSLPLSLLSLPLSLLVAPTPRPPLSARLTLDSSGGPITRFSRQIEAV